MIGRRIGILYLGRLVERTSINQQKRNTLLSCLLNNYNVSGIRDIKKTYFNYSFTSPRYWQFRRGSKSGLFESGNTKNKNARSGQCWNYLDMHINSAAFPGTYQLRISLEGDCHIKTIGMLVGYFFKQPLRYSIKILFRCCGLSIFHT